MSNMCGAMISTVVAPRTVGTTLTHGVTILSLWRQAHAGTLKYSMHVFLFGHYVAYMLPTSIDERCWEKYDERF